MWEKLPYVSIEHIDVESCMGEYVELQIDILVSVHSSFLEKNDVQGAI